MDLLNIEYEKYKLKNGLEVILHKDDNLPLVAVNLWYRVGSANEKQGGTGMAHLFEHMMFQGSENIPKEMHFKYIQEAGGSLNGSTNFDRTNYYEKLPSNFLELALWLESDRMGFFLQALTQEKLDNQKSVVINERLERYDNQPYGLAWEILLSNLYPLYHPYSWPTIGLIDDISRFTLDEVSAFFKRYYSPSNASVTVAGNFDEKFVKENIEKYFSEIPDSIERVEINSSSVKLESEKLITREENVQLERIYLAWSSEKAYGNDDAALDILADILSGSKNSRLYKNLVYEKELAQDVSAYHYSGKLAGHFMIIATVKKEKSPDTIKDEIFKELGMIEKNGITERELKKTKNNIRSGFIFSLQNLDAMANQLNYYNYFLNEPNSFNYDLNRYNMVTIDKIKSVTNDYFSKPYIELRVKPKK
ncbi:MAG TPA: pitrilysin family protein [Ignavibacteriaceae bacterium]|jgi:zinc protease|nr:pitrilysin family protein [Ignavibacteriaceae bacterium]